MAATSFMGVQNMAYAAVIMKQEFPAFLYICIEAGYKRQRDAAICRHPCEKCVNLKKNL